MRFADADLIGVPTRVVIGKRLASTGTIEVKDRATGETTTIPIDGAATAVAAVVRAKLA